MIPVYSHFLSIPVVHMFFLYIWKRWKRFHAIWIWLICKTYSKIPPVTKALHKPSSLTKKSYIKIYTLEAHWKIYHNQISGHCWHNIQIYYILEHQQKNPSGSFPDSSPTINRKIRPSTLLTVTWVPFESEIW